MLSFYAGTFAVAGLIAAVGPLLIHLLNRRRFRVVRWAAMDFLREALRRERRMLQIRDLLLLALRTACVLLFGLAMARPYFSRSSRAVDPDQPVHAVLVIDTSLSMGYQKLDGTLLDEAKARAREFIDRLPAGSRISVLPLCGPPGEFSRDAFRTREDALEALSRLSVADSAASAARAADLALEACQRAPDVPSKRVVFIGDQQVQNWSTGSISAQLGKLPEMQVVQVAAPDPENAWIADFKAEDGIADLQTPAIFLARLRYEGKARRPGVQVTLSIDGAAAGSQTVDLEPGQAREVSFTHRFETPGLATAVLSLPPDRLPADDRRFLVVPVLNSLPVVFIDQYGEEESPKANLYGETFRLRRLLVPVTSREDAGRSLIQIRHRKIGEVDRGLLADARLAVIAGVERPDPAVAVLREYLLQGGRLVIAAGGEFDPRAWNDAAWLDGAGILPAPLDPLPVGSLPEETPGELKPFQIDPRSLVHDWFLLDQVSREELDDLYREPLFFKAVRAVMDEGTLSKMVEAEARRIEEERRLLAAAEDRRRKGAEAGAPAEPAPSWLLWEREIEVDDRDLDPGDLARRTRPRSLASFTNGVPFIVERDVGRGQVLLVSSGVLSGWNTLTRTNAALLFDRIFRGLLERTLPVRNLTTIERFQIPVEPSDRRARFTLYRPGDIEEPLTVDALGGDSYGLTIRDLTLRGHYKVTARRDERKEPGGLPVKLWETTLAANGPEEESDLRYLDGEAFRGRMGAASCRWVSPQEPITLEGAQIRGQDLWKGLMFLVLCCLLAEVSVLAWPMLRKAGERAA